MTILFAADWYDKNNRPRALVHSSTKNYSFKRIVPQLRSMGIQNCLFPLSLYDPTLLNIDPHTLDADTDPSGDLRMRVAAECNRNIWYFFREVLRVPVDGSDSIPYKLDRGNLAMTWCFMNHIDFNGTQPRQTGKAQPLDALIKTPTGWTRMGDVKLGDLVVAANGASTPVIGVYPQGAKDIYLITLEDGRTTKCCAEHLWMIYDGETVSVQALRQFKDRVDIYLPVADPAIDESEGIPLRKIKTITSVGRQTAQCIAIDHPSQLYITDDYIVTHNTIGAISITAWVMYIFGFNMTMGMLTHSADLVQANVKRLKGMKEGLPPYLLHADYNGPDVDNKEGLDYKALGNTYHTYIGQKDRSAANRVGRGKTGPILHIDETGYIPNIRITFPAIMATTNTAVVNARRAGQPHSNIYTTTAADPQTDEGAYAFELVTQAMPFTEKLYDCVNEEAAHAMVKANSTNGLVNGTFSYLQLGYTHEWFHATIHRNNVPPDEVERDYRNHWISAAKYPIVSKALLAKMNASKRPPDHVEVFDSYVINWYVPKEVSSSPAFRNSPMILGMDSSEMIGQDFTTFVVIDPKTLKTLCTFRCNDSNTMKIALFVARFLIAFKRAVFVPERKSTGVTIIDTVILMLLRERHNPFLRIFNQIVDKNDQEEFRKYDLHDPTLSDTTARKFLGFMTSQTTRTFLYKEILQHAAALVADNVADITLVTEISGLQAVNGRIDHKTGHHDDMIIAWLLACWLVLEGKNLHYYGLSKDDLLPSNVSTQTGGDQQHIANQLELCNQIQALDQQWRNAQNDIVRAHLRYKIAQLQQYVDDTLQIEPTSIETIRRSVSPLRPLTEATTRTQTPINHQDFLEVLHL